MEAETRDTFTLFLAPPAEAPRFSFRPGQFNMLYVFGVGEVPISISGSPERPKTLIHTVRSVGAVSAAKLAADGYRLIADLQREAEGLERAPYPGELGQRIYDHISKEAWAGWLRHQTMLINEYRLAPASKESQEIIAQQMEQFFFGQGAHGFLHRQRRGAPEPGLTRVGVQQ